MLSYVPAVVHASRAAESPDAGTPAGTVVVRAADLTLWGPGFRPDPLPCSAR